MIENREGLTGKGVYAVFDKNTGELLKVGETEDWMTRFQAYSELQAITDRQLAIRMIETPGASTQNLSAAEDAMRASLESTGELLPWDNEGGRLASFGLQPSEYGPWVNLRSWLTRYPNW